MSDEALVSEVIICGDWDGALERGQAWADSESGGPLAYFALNAVYLLKGDFRLAWQMYPKCLQEEGDITKVQEWVDRLRQEHPATSSVHLLYGLFLAQSGQSENSIGSYHEAMKHDPQSPYPHFFLAQIQQRMGRIDQAIKSYREAVRLDPTYIAARLNLGVAFQEQGQLEMAIPQYREIIKMRPNDLLGHMNLGCALAEQGKIDAAIVSYKEAVKLDPCSWHNPGNPRTQLVPTMRR